MEVFVNGVPLTPTYSRKGQWLLALSVLRGGRPVENGWLQAKLWPESSKEQGADNLKHSRLALRKVLGREGRCLRRLQPGCWSFDLDDADVDVLVFDAAVARGDDASLQAAVALYRGPLLDGCPEEWVLEERESYEQKYLAALERLAAGAAKREEFTAAAEYLRRVVAVDPTRETAQRALLQALADGGNHGAMIRTYRRLHTQLRSEYRTVPATETTALFEKLRDTERERSDVRPLSKDVRRREPGLKWCLPRLLQSLVGRDAELEELHAALERACLVTLTGPGGIGKTQLALQFGWEVLEEYAGGVWFVELAAVQDPAHVAQRIAAVLRVRERGGVSPLERLCEYLRPRRLLLVLDNCEHVAAECASLADDLLRACPWLQIVATSREHLQCEGERLFAVPPLSLPPALDVSVPTDLRAVADASAAVRLFAQRAAGHWPGFMLTPANTPAVLEVCRRLDGLPLAIVMAAAQVKQRPIAEIAARLADCFPDLASPWRTPRPHQETLRATLDWSFALLSAPAAALFPWLAVFAGGWTREAAEAIYTTSGAVLPLLAELESKSFLVVQEDTQGTVRYRMLQTIRQYGLERLREQRGEAVARASHAAFYLKLAERAASGLHGKEQRSWLDHLIQEHDNLRAALGWFLESGAMEPGLRLAASLWPFWETIGYWHEGREWFEKLFTAYGQIHPEPRFTGDNRHNSLPRDPAYRKPLSPRLRARALLGAGILAHCQGDYTAARPAIETSLSIARELDDTLATANALTALGTVVQGQGQVAEAQALYEQSLTLQRGLGNDRGIANALYFLGRIARPLGELTTARSLFEECLAIRQHQGDTLGIASVLNDLGLVSLHQGDFAIAQAHFEQALALSRESADRCGIAWALNNLGVMYRDRGDCDNATPAFDEALTIQRELGSSFGLAVALNDRGLTYLLQSQLEEAERDFTKSLSIFHKIGDQWGVAMSLHHRGLATLRQGDTRTARSFLRTSLSLRRDLGLQKGIAECLAALAEVAHAQGQYEHGTYLFGAAEMLRETIGAPLPLPMHSEYERWKAETRSRLGEEAFAAAWAKGRAMTIKHVIEETLGERES
jgi:predicted ATPase/Tfp pilus assembly protein PilF